MHRCLHLWPHGNAFQSKNSWAAGSSKSRSTRSYKEIDKKCFGVDLRDSSLLGGSSCDLNCLVEHYDCTLKRLLDTHDPVRSKVVAIRRRVPWYTEVQAQTASALPHDASLPELVEQFGSFFRTKIDNIRQRLNSLPETSIAQPVEEGWPSPSGSLPPSLNLKCWKLSGGVQRRPVS